ncbi:MAG TPA: polysaccharide export protein EpsE [Pseudoduganella sp.]
MKRLLMWMVAMALVLGAGFAQAADLTLGAGDVIKASVFGNPDMATETRVSESGKITFPLLGEVKVSGLTVQQAERAIGEQLVKKGYLKNAQVSIIVSQIQSAQVSVLGMVNRPGRYPLDGGKRGVMDMLAQAGGFNADGGDTVSVVRTRDGKTTKTVIDVVDMVRNGALDKEIELGPNDVIYAERSPRFYIYGEVQRPGSFRLERAMTVSQALAVGGGLTPRGTERGIKIKRRNGDGSEHVIAARNEDVVQTDDVIFIKESWF